MDDRPLQLAPTCIHLRHKMMYVDERQMTPGFVDNQSDTRVFWCNETMDPLGPDRRPVGPDECRSATRSCCTMPTHARPATT
jgi:hypothetical protein